MRISDWSSDVCSSDLLRRLPQQGGHAPKVQGLLAIMPASSSQPARRLDLNLARQFSGWSRSTSATCQANWAPVAARPSQNGDRKSDVEGKSVSVRVDLGGRRIIKKKKRKKKQQ